MNETPNWFNTGRTVLLIKDREKGKDVINFRSITIYPLMWKMFTGIFNDQLYNIWKVSNKRGTK